MEEKNIADMWKNHYANLFNSVNSVKYKSEVENAIQHGVHDNSIDIVTKTEVAKAIASLSNNKAIGPDGISAEHLKYAEESLVELLTICFNAMLVHGDLPDMMITTYLY